MKKRFFIQIEADFLLNVYEDLLPFTPWLYLYFRFRQNYFPNQSSQTGIFINTTKLSKELGTTQTLIWKSLREMIKKGLAVKLETKNFMIFKESKYIENISKTHKKSFDTKNAFFQISKDFFDKYWGNYKYYNELRIYYYLLMKNNHFLFYKKDDKRILIGDGIITLTDIWKELKIHRLSLKKHLDFFKEKGLIEEDGEKIYTLSENFVLKKDKMSI